MVLYNDCHHVRRVLSTWPDAGTKRVRGCGAARRITMQRLQSIRARHCAKNDSFAADQLHCFSSVEILIRTQRLEILLNRWYLVTNSLPCRLSNHSALKLVRHNLNSRQASQHVHEGLNTTHHNHQRKFRFHRSVNSNV